MQRFIPAVGLVVLLAATATAAGQDKKGERPAGKNAQEVALLAQAGEVTGRVARVSSGRGFTLLLGGPTVVPHGASRTRLGARPNFRVVQNTRNYELEVDDEVVVRTMQLPPKFDDKGKPTKYTAEEMKELKGDKPGLPGYVSDYDSLKPGQLVTVTFGKKKPAPKEKGDDAKPADNTPRVTKIVILAQGEAPAGTRNRDNPPEKKKKDN